MRNGKQIITKDGNFIYKLGRKKKLYFNDKGIFFKWNGTRYYFDNIMNLTYPVMYYENGHYLHAIGGYMGITNCFGVLVELIDDEFVQLYTEE